MTEDSWIIEPYVRFGHLRFGATQAEVASLIGPADTIDRDSESSLVTEYRCDNGLQAVFHLDSGVLVMVSAYSNVCGIRIAGEALDWTDTRGLYRKLVAADARARQTVGITVFFSLGVALAGFLDRDVGGKSITAFAQGQWDERDPALKSIELP
jgi:hypothetical protein